LARCARRFLLGVGGDASGGSRELERCPLGGSDCSRPIQVLLSETPSAGQREHVGDSEEIYNIVATPRGKGQDWLRSTRRDRHESPSSRRVQRTDSLVRGIRTSRTAADKTSGEVAIGTSVPVASPRGCPMAERSRRGRLLSSFPAAARGRGLLLPVEIDGRSSSWRRGSLRRTSCPLARARLPADRPCVHPADRLESDRVRTARVLLETQRAAQSAALALVPDRRAHRPDAIAGYGSARARGRCRPTAATVSWRLRRLHRKPAAS
jgi:hypothetical protein